MNKIISSIAMTDGRGCPVRDKMLVERTNPATTLCPVRDNICVEHVAYLTARPCLREYSFSTNIPSLTGCRPVEKTTEDFILSAFHRLFALCVVLVLSTIILCVSCSKDKEKYKEIEGISFENYPKVDGSTSCRALNVMVACKILNVRYDWRSDQPFSEEWFLEPTQNDLPKKHKDFFLGGERIKTSQTHGAFMNLIDGNSDIILTHRTISPDEKAHTDALGVTLIETSIALDAFVFIVNRNNPVKSLTVDEIQKIYTEIITNWSEVGGNNESMQVFTRPRNSGSEEVFRTLVMNGIEPSDFPASSEIISMAPVFMEIAAWPNGICYTFNNFKDIIVRVSDSSVPKIAINNVFPDENTVKDGTYPFISEVHVAIRSDLDPNSMAYKLYEWLQSEDAKSTIIECGFIPKNNIK